MTSVVVRRNGVAAVFTQPDTFVPNSRKRKPVELDKCDSSEAPPTKLMLAPATLAPATAGEGSVKNKQLVCRTSVPSASNNGWGELFINRDVFVGMHLR